MMSRPSDELFYACIRETEAWAQQNDKIILHQAQEIDSTNSWAKREIQKLSTISTEDKSKIHLYTAQHQTHGRGRNSRVWSDSPQSCFMSSWVFSLPTPPAPILSPLIGLAVYESLQKTWPSLMDAGLALKAPNDIYINDNKMAGLLIEVVQEGSSPQATTFMIIGLGLNMTQPPVEIPHAISLGIALDLDLHNPTLVSTNWSDFLHFLQLSFHEAVVLKGTKSHLDQIDQNKIRTALNRLPSTLRGDEILSVSPKGDLITAQKTRPWFEL